MLLRWSRTVYAMLFYWVSKKASAELLGRFFPPLAMTGPLSSSGLQLHSYFSLSATAQKGDLTFIGRMRIRSEYTTDNPKRLAPRDLQKDFQSFPSKEFPDKWHTFVSTWISTTLTSSGLLVHRQTRRGRSKSLFDINMLLVWHIRETEHEDTLRGGPKSRPVPAL
jgi:hypothetical protein